MNDQLQHALAALLNKTIAGIDAGTQFLSAQLPDVIHQLLVWKAAISLIVFAVGVLLLVAVALSLRLYKHPEPLAEKDHYDRLAYKPSWLWDEHGATTVGVVPLAVCQIGATVIGAAMLTNLSWLQIWLAPKVYLIEYAAHLAK